MENQNAKTLGIISLISSIVAIFIFGFILSLVATITGLLGWKENSLAKTGAIIGIIELVIVILYFIAV